MTMNILPNEPTLLDLIDQYRSRLKKRPSLDELNKPVGGDYTPGNMAHPGGPLGTDTVPAWLTPGENVVNAEASQIFQPQIDQMNKVGQDIQQGQMPAQNPNAIIDDTNTQMFNIGGKVKKIYKEGYTAPGQAYAIAKSMGYQEGGQVPVQQPSILQQAGDLAASPGGAALGKRLSLIGAGDLKGAAEVSAADFAPKKGQVDEGQSLDKIIRLASSAYNLIPAATPALRVAQQAEVDPTLRGAALAGVTVGGDAGAIKEFIETYTKPAVRLAVQEGKIGPEAESAYIRLVADITDLTTVALQAQGSGPKTDFDFLVAARATANLQSTPATIQSSMKRMIDNANSARGSLGLPPVQVQLSTAPIPTADSNPRIEKSQKTYSNDDVKPGDRFVGNDGTLYIAGNGLIKQTSGFGKGTEYTGEYLRYNSEKKLLQISSYGTWYDLYKVTGGK